MLSHLRFHRRAPSNPTSPIPDQGSPWESGRTQDSPQTSQDLSSPPDTRPRSSHASSNAPPTLPPIARVTTETDMIFDKTPFDQPSSAPAPTMSKSPPQPRSSYNAGTESGFMGGVALANYRKSLQQGQHMSSGSPTPMMPPQALTESNTARPKPRPPPINTGVTGRPPVASTQAAKASSFITPTENRRPSGTRTRLTTEPASLSHYPASGSTAAVETQKTKKGLLSLKNPVSTLLMRRKAGQNASDTSPQPLALRGNEPFHDPRIRGTRVHDFSAPRPRKIVTTTPDQTATVNPPPSSEPPLPAPKTGVDAYGAVLERDLPSTIPEGGQDPTALLPAVPKSRLEDEHNTLQHGPEKAEVVSSPPQPGNSASDGHRRISLTETPLPDSPVPPVPLKSRSRMTPEIGVSTLPKATPSTRTVMSRNVSAAGRSIRDGTIAALPRHMKSTSSRFSFDMIGAAKQERLLEERHRQRELERKDNESDEPSVRDSRFDDLDDFDYDAMLDDDGLEERIPGVNADAEDDYYLYEEEEIPMIGEEDDEIPMIGVDETTEDEEAAMDPDNDQENFSGFVFQRSNPVSALTSPHSPYTLATPRDEAGKVIGFAVTKDSNTPELSHSAQPATSPLDINYPGLSLNRKLDGLGIDGVSPDFPPQGQLDFGEHHEVSPIEVQAEATQPKQEEIYYDGGFVGDFADELDFETYNPTEEAFDESIFDLDDTDQYGRPLPGVFAQAQAQRKAEKAAVAKRESDITSRLSEQSVMLHSTTQTSVSIDLPSAPTATDHSEATAVPVAEAEAFAVVTEPSIEAQQQHRSPTISERDARYQAALAEAANKAAASGKFRRDSSPPPLPADLTITSPTTASDAPLSGRSEMGGYVDDDYYEDDPYTQDMDDYDLDDDDIVAEANASALANDSDGFYGQEFGFYSNAPALSSHHGSSGNGNAALSQQNLYQYSSGGYFGPSGGLDRSKSGRIVSREPNLTPITERSEYSNRNSIMSLGMPSAGLASASLDRSLQSPGLAQLAMLADDGDMTLSSLLRLRSRAWGGSQISLASSREGSPRSERPPHTGADGAMSPWSPPGAGPSSSAAGLSYLGGVGHARKGSAFSVHSRDSDAGSAAGSPTVTMNFSFPSTHQLPLRSLSSPTGSMRSRPTSLTLPTSHRSHTMTSPTGASLGRASPRVRSPSLDDNRVVFIANGGIGMSQTMPSLNSVFALSPAASVSAGKNEGPASLGSGAKGSGEVSLSREDHEGGKI